MWQLDCEESWVLKNWCFWTMVLRRLLRIPWTARGSNQSILKEISLEYSFEGLMLKLNRQYFGHLMWRAVSFEKILMLGKIEGRRKRRQQRMKWMASLTRWAWVSVNSGSSWWTRRPVLLQFMVSQKVRLTERLNWMNKYTLSWVNDFRELLQESVWTYEMKGPWML